MQPLPPTKTVPTAVRKLQAGGIPTFSYLEGDGPASPPDPEPPAEPDEEHFLRCRGLSCSFRNHLQLLFFYFLEWEMAAWAGSNRLPREEGCVIFARICQHRIPLNLWAHEIRSHGLVCCQQRLLEESRQLARSSSSSVECGPPRNRKGNGSARKSSSLLTLEGWLRFVGVHLSDDQTTEPAFGQTGHAGGSSSSSCLQTSSSQEVVLSLEEMLDDRYGAPAVDGQQARRSRFADQFEHCVRVHSKGESGLVSGHTPLPNWVWSLAEWHLEAAIGALWGQEHAGHGHPFLRQLFRRDTARLVAEKSPFTWFGEYVRLLHERRGTKLEDSACLPLPVTADEYAEHCRAVHDKKQGTHTKHCKQTHGVEADALSFFVHLQKPADQPTAWTAPVTPAMRSLFTLSTEGKSTQSARSPRLGKACKTKLGLSLLEKLRAIEEGEEEQGESML